MGKAPVLAAGQMPRDPRQDPALGAGDRALWLLQLGVCQTVTAILGHVCVPRLHTLGPQAPMMAGPIRANSASSPYLVPQILWLTVHDGYLD